MSELQTVQIATPEITSGQRAMSKQVEAVLRGPVEQQFIQVNATQATTSNLNWQFYTGSNDLLIGRDFIIEKTVQLDFTGSGTGNLLQIGKKFYA